MSETFLVGGVRTPVGRYEGALADVRPDDLAALVLGEVVTRTGIPAERIDDVVFGAANQSGDDNRNVARMAVLLAGLPVSVTGQTVNRLCASGLQAIATASQGVRAGDWNLVVAGGAESMSRAPFVTEKPAEPGAEFGEHFSTALGWRLVNPKMVELDGGEATLSLGACTEKLAKMYGITREEADAYAVRSQTLTAQGWDDGVFDDEVVAVGSFTRDETVRPGTTMESLAKLKPAFTPEGVCTAGNSSPLSDGASAILVASAEALSAYGLVPRARVLSYAVAGVAPSLFGLGPVPAIEKALAIAGLSLDQMDIIDINEAFSAQVLACEKELSLDRARLNPGGGAIALGHPLGSSGSRIMVSLLGQLERTGGRYGVASLCIGVGQGAAMVVERV